MCVLREPLPSGRGARQGGEGTHATTPKLLHRLEVLDTLTLPSPVPPLSLA